MPYIEQEDREKIFIATDEENRTVRLSKKTIGMLMGKCARNGGDIQYMIATALQVYMEEKGFRYANMESVMGALTGALREFQRKVVDPYEAIKEAENGVIYKLPIHLRSKVV